MTAPIDWLVLTAAHRRQAKAYASQLATRAERGVLARAEGVIVVPDAMDRRIGSGAATALALVQVARQLAQRRPARSFDALFADRRIVMLHSGGDSRRLPMYAAEGKLFASVPMRAAGSRCAAVFDLLLADLMTLAPRAGGEVLVGAGDAVIGLARDVVGDGAGDGDRDRAVRFEGEGVIGVAQRAEVARAVRHGVFVRGANAGVGARAGASAAGAHEVAAFLQKPSESALRAAGALDGDGLALVDTGLMSFDPRAIEALLEGCGVALARDGAGVVLRKGGLADLASRAELPPLDLYREMLMALPAAAARADYLAAVDAAAAPQLGAYFDAMRGTRFTVRTAASSGFLHIGSTREMLESLVSVGGDDAPAPALAFGVDGFSVPLAPRACSGEGGFLALDAMVPEVEVAAGRAIADRVIADRLALGGDNIIVGVEVEGELALPRGVSLFGVAVHEEVGAYIACGLDDDFKTRLDAGGTVLGLEFAEFARRSGIAAEDCIAGDGTLWDARLWCAAGSEDRFSRVRWMWEGTPAPDEWRRAPRISLRELVEHADLDDIADRREAIALAALWPDPIEALLGAVDAADARLVHERLAAGSTEERTLALGNAAEEAFGLPDPIARAHVTATLSEVSRGIDAGLEAGFREAAFHAVGEAVLSHFELPTRPQRAAILHDQAVWTSMPVRVDLAGGWSDTPPICNEVGGSVVNVAVTLRGQLPIQVVAKLEELRKGEAPVIRITSTDLGQTREIRTMADLAERGDPTRWSALAESALVLAGIAPSDPDASLADWLAKVGGGLSLTMFSAVPKGSGLGTSSILGAATIQCLDRVLGRDRTPDQLFAATSALEQMLSTRGGWQDQVGGVLGGFKIARSEPGALQRPAVEAIDVPAALARELRGRSLLYFTGERRMAKNILENVVWNWLVRDPAAVKAVEKLRANAERMRDALARGDLDATVGELTEYMKRKRQIDPGSCPQSFDDLAARWQRELAAWCFAGAGGGGFMLLVAKDPQAAEALRAKIERDPPNPRARAFDFEVDPVGLRCAVL